MNAVYRVAILMSLAAIFAVALQIHEDLCVQNDLIIGQSMPVQVVPQSPTPTPQQQGWQE